MENTGEYSTNRFYVEEMDAGYSRVAVKIIFVKPDGSDFSDSEMDKIFWKAFEYSENGPSSTERDGSRMIIAMKDFGEARELIKGIAVSEDNINITEKVNIISSYSNSLNYRVTLARREDEEFSNAEINAIFQNVLNGSAFEKFEPSTNRKEVSVYFRSIKEWREFIEQFMSEDAKKNMKKRQLPKKEEKKGFFSRFLTRL